jgi:hypothetical protein
MPVVSLNTYRILQTARFYPATIREGFRQIVRVDPKLQRLVDASGGEAIVMEAIYRLLREAIKEDNADKNYILEKLKSDNALAEDISDYLAEIIGAGMAGSDGPYRCRRFVLLSWLPADQRTRLGPTILNEERARLMARRTRLT